MRKLAALLFLLTLAPPLLADDILVKEVGGLPVIRCKIFNGSKHIVANLLFDAGLGMPLVIHEKSLNGLGLSPAQAVGKEVEIEFDRGLRWKGIPMQPAAVRMLETMTSQYAKELAQIPVVGILGLEAMNSNVVEFDLHNGLLRTLGMASETVREKEMDYEDQPSGIRLKGTGPTGAPVKVVLAMRNQDSILKFSLLEEARDAGKKPNVLDVNGIKFSDHAAFRFNPLEQVDAVVGMNALRDYTVTIWPKRKKIAFVAQATPAFPQDIQDFFFALADKNPDGVAAFIEKKPGRRLMDEACMALWNMRLNDPGSSAGLLEETLQTLVANFNPARCSVVLTTIADALDKGRHPEKEGLSMLALDLAMKQASKSLKQTAVHGVHLRLGRKAFAKNDLKQARRHLLSAAFGMPKNGECNFWMGEVYREMGKPRRAWSRYFQAILDPQVDLAVRDDCFSRIEALNRDPGFRATFDMIEAEQYMAGRLEGIEFHAASRYQLDKYQYPGHVKLVEFFTNPDPETAGMQLAFQALDEYFEGAVSLIAYHHDTPMHSKAALNRLAYYEAEDAPLVVFDGKPGLDRNVSTAKIPSENAAENFEPFRDACLRKKTEPGPAWQPRVEMTKEGTKVSGSLSVAGSGPADELRLHAVLCERSVMAVRPNGMFFHHFVARRALTPYDGLVLKDVMDQPQSFNVDAEEISNALLTPPGSLDLVNAFKNPIGFVVDMEKHNKDPARRMPESGDQPHPPYVDANQLMVVAFVQHRQDRRILAAQTFRLPQEEAIR